MRWWNKSLKLAFVATTFALFTTGCAEPEAPAPPAVEEAAPIATTPNPAAAPESVKRVEAKASAGIDNNEPDEVAYTPPFSDRNDLFGVPKREGHSKTKSGEYDEAVELIGFADLDRPQALLLINGQITTLAEGESRYGVEVVSIQPPKVVLQRGRQRWQTSLEN